MPAKGEKGKGFMAEKWGTRDDLRDISQELKDQLNTYDKIDDVVNRTLKVKQLSLAAAKSAGDIDNKTTKDKLKSHKLDAEALDMAKDMVDSVKQRLAGFKKIIAGARLFNLVAKANPYVLLVGIIIAIGAAFLKFQKAVAETRKDLGVSATEAAVINTKLWAAGKAAALWGGTQEDIKASFDAIRANLGGIDAANISFVSNLAKVALRTGQTAEGLSQVLSIQESISSASRETLLAQMEATAATIRLRGVAPGAIFKDIAENAEFFAQYAKDGGKNIQAAAVQARKLGVNLSTVAGITESLMDFESSIEKQLEASMLLGRQINLDKARQLAFLGKNEEMMQEVLKQVGGEAEFTRLLPIQRKALADAVGINVQELSKLVRDRGAAGMAAAGNAVAAQIPVQEKQLTVLEEIREGQNWGIQYGKKTADAVSGLQ